MPCLARFGRYEVRDPSVETGNEEMGKNKGTELVEAKVGKRAKIQILPPRSVACLRFNTTPDELPT